MEDDLTFFVNGRLPIFFCKWKTSPFFVNGRRLHIFLEIEDDLNISFVLCTYL